MEAVKEKLFKHDFIKSAKNVDADILLPRLVFIICSIALMLFGLIMVFSASTIISIETENNPFIFLLCFIIINYVHLSFVWLNLLFSLIYSFYMKNNSTI